MQIFTKQRRQTFTTGVEWVWSFLLYSIPAVVVGLSVYIVHSARANSAAIDIASSIVICDRAAAAVDAYLLHLARELRAIASIPDVTALSPQPGDTAESILTRDVSRYLALLTSTKTAANARDNTPPGRALFRELLVASSDGPLVAASGRAENFDQRGELWWERGSSLPRTCIDLKTCAYAETVSFDKSVGGRGFALAVPIYGRPNEATAVLKAVVNADEIESLLTLAAASHPIEVLLMRRDGTNALREEPATTRANSLPKELVELKAGNQAHFQMEQRAVTVRALPPPLGEVWAVAVRSQVSPATNTQLIALTGIVLVMFFVSARAYALLFERIKEGRHATNTQ